MKVTAIIDDKTIKDAMKYSKSTTVTETLKVALNEYIRIQKLKNLGRLVKYEQNSASTSFSPAIYNRISESSKN